MGGKIRRSKTFLEENLPSSGEKGGEGKEEEQSERWEENHER